MTDNPDPAIRDFREKITPWFVTYRHLVTSYLAIRTGESWRVCAARHLLVSDVEREIPSDFVLCSANLCAGIQVRTADPTAIHALLDALVRSPASFAAHGREFNLAKAADQTRIQIYFAPVNHMSIPGTRQSPGLRISCSEDIPPPMPSERLLDTEVQGADPHFPSTGHLISHLGLDPNVLRLSVQPCLDVIALAPAIVRPPKFNSKGCRLDLVASAALAPDEIIVKSSAAKDGKLQHLLSAAKALKWEGGSGECWKAVFDFTAEADEISVALVYRGTVLDSWVGSATRPAGGPTVADDPFLGHVHAVAVALGHDKMAFDILRLPAMVEEAPEDALRAAKDLIEGCCKTVIERRGRTVSPNADLPKLVHMTLSLLDLAPSQVTDRSRAASEIKGLLDSLSKLAGNVGVLRNRYGAGHGKEASFKGLEAKHARLAAMAAMAFVTFVADTHLNGDA